MARPTKGNCVLNDHGAFIREVVEVGLEGQVVVQRLDVGRQHFSYASNRGRSMLFSAKVSAHVAPVRTVSLCDEGCICLGCECSAGCVVNKGRRSGGVGREGRGAGVQLSA
jgi:hypothetical protein